MKKTTLLLKGRWRAALLILLLGAAGMTNAKAQGTHAYVDLGLPSGLLWATCNVGADTPEGYGSYFAWGETQPKSYYDWNTYQHCNGDLEQLTKYCSNASYGYNGFTDGLTVLLPEDDAATANWGEGWRMPTEEEWEELRDNTIVEWTTRNGVAGRRFTAANGNSLFLPAAGYRWVDELDFAGYLGNYWSSSLDTGGPYSARGFTFDSGGYGMDYGSNRYYGRSVRAVREDLTLVPINAVPSPAEGGTVSGGGAYAEGETCTLTATASAGYTFVNWTDATGATVSTNAIYTFTVAEDASFVANFTLDNGYHWDVNVSTYPNTLTMIGVIEINNVEQMSTTLEVGAFCGDECRGRERATADYVNMFGHYFVFLTVYGNDNDQINFRLYDHAIGQELDLTCSPLVFQTNGLFGDPGTPYVFEFGPSQITQTTDLTSGWNWWSTYVEADDLFNQLKTGLGANATQIKSSTTFVNYFNGMWIGGLSSISNESCYLIKANNACTLETTGMQAMPADHPITINPNWNWIGYPNTGAQSVANAFSNFTPTNGDQVKSLNAFATYYNGMWVGGLSAITPGMGLLYKSTSAGTRTLIYPEANRSEEWMENVTNEDNHWTADYHAYPGNMTVMAVVEFDDVELQGENYEIAAFANSECRGSARLMYVAPINRYIAFLTIVGDEASELRFSLYDSETGVVETQDVASLRYETNATIGSLETPYVVRFRNTTGMDEWATKVNVFPNPVNRGERFSLGMTSVETLHATSVQIINALGMAVETQNLASPQDLAAPKVAGVYTLRITVEGQGTCYRKLVVR